MSNIELLVAALERDVLHAKKQREQVIEKISSIEFVSSFDLDTFIELDAKEYASQFVLDIICDPSFVQKDENDVIIEEYEDEWTFKIIRDRILYEITRITSAPRSTSQSSNSIDNARHYALINLLRKI